MPLPSGASFDRYVIEGLLGQGGMGRVYRAFDPRLHRRVALKILDGSASGTFSPSPQGVAAILREAQAAAALDAPNVVAIYDIGDHEGVPFLAMELVQGRALRAFVGRQDVPLERRLGWLLQIARALATAHRAGVIHRDVKPENIMVRDDDVVKVLDFGIAHQVARAPMPAGIVAGEAIDAPASAGLFVGTPSYGAPEQLLGDEVDGRADQFSWGVVAYELLVGRSPWSQPRTMSALVRAVLDYDPPSLAAQGVAVTTTVDAVVMRALSKTPEARFTTMGALLEALGVPETAPAPTAGVDRGAETLPRVPPASGPAGAAGQQRSPGEIPRSPRRGRRWIAGITAILGVALVVTGIGWKGAHKEPPATAAPAPTTLVELPPPSGCTAGATTAYEAGIHAMRDGNWERSAASFEQAVRADPECPAVLLWTTLTRIGTRPIAETRAVYQRAMLLRGRLTERDRLLLEALDPLVRSEPADLRAYRGRLLGLVERYPGDAQLWEELALATQDPEEAIAASHRALAIDPGYSDGYQTVGRALWKLGRIDEALTALDTCARRAPSSVDCPRERITRLSRIGRCAEAADSARQWIARDPDTSEGYLGLGSTLLAQGSAGASEEAFGQRWARLPADRRGAVKDRERAALAALSGDLAGAEQRARVLLRTAANSPSFEAHARPALLLVDVLTEQGRVDEAAAVAADVLGRRAAWSNSLAETALLDLPRHFLEPRLLLAARRGGRLPEAEWRAARTRWAAAVHAAGLATSVEAWALDQAMPVETAAEAIAALGTLPAEDREPPVLPQSAAAFLGRTMLLAGHADEAVRYLGPAAASCAANVDPLLATRTHLWLGHALEKTGNTAGACAAYATVAARLGRTTLPARSTSAEAAQKRADALGCKR